MKKTIAVLPGDGVGPEVVAQSIKVLKAIAYKYNHNFNFNYGLIGVTAIDKIGNPLPDETFDLCQKSDAILLGAVGDPKYDNEPNFNIRPEQGLLKLRKLLGLFANIRPVKIYKELIDISPLKKEKLKDVNLVIVRELTGGIYFGKPRKRVKSGSKAIDTSTYTRDEIYRVSHMAFKLAKKRGKKVTSVDKANVLETSRLWRETVAEVAKNYPEVELNHLYVDNAAMQLIKNPCQFNIVLTENMFGDILSDEASVLTGSIGLLPSASIGKIKDQRSKINNPQSFFGLYEPVHGAFNRATGKNIANPVGTILSSAMMLKMSFGLEKEAQAIEKAVEKTLKRGYRTKDIAGKDIPPEKILGTKEMGNLISTLI